MSEVISSENVNSNGVKASGFSGAVLKTLAIIIMTIDHIGAVLLLSILNSRGLDSMATADSSTTVAWVAENGVLLELYYVCRYIGRIAFPLFAFLLVEGFGHTKNKLKHAIRLGLFVLVSEIPFDLGFKGQVLEFTYQNVMLTLLIGFLVMWGMEWLENRQEWSRVAKALTYPAFFAFGYFAYYMFAKCWIGDMLFTNIGWSGGYFDWGFIIPACLVGLVSLSLFIIYFEKKDVELRDRNERFVGVSSEQAANQRFAVGYSCYIIMVGCLLADLLKTDYSGWGVMVIVLGYLFRKDKGKCGLIINIGLVLSNVMEIWAFFSMIAINKYNGTKGKQNKYFFYVYYPLHLLVLWGLTKFVQ